jgi:hypothetical protein
VAGAIVGGLIGSEGAGSVHGKFKVRSNKNQQSRNQRIVKSHIINRKIKTTSNYK